LDLNIEKVSIVINRSKGKEEEGVKRVAMEMGLEVDGVIRDDEMLTKDDLEGKSIFSLDKKSIALVDAYGIFEEHLRKIKNY
jgi:CO dehydrogenase nickel-insertion accessory protein CooC1